MRGHHSRLSLICLLGWATPAPAHEIAFDARISQALVAATALAVADLDGDGDDDLIVSVDDGSSSQVTLLRNDGGAVWTPVQLLVPTSAATLTVADVDRDGRPDVLVGGLGGVDLWRSDDSGLWAATSVLGPGVLDLGSAELLAADLDRDGDLDVAYAGNSELGWIENTGGADSWTDHLLPAVSAGFTGETAAIAVGDLDRDGLLDLVGSEDAQLIWWAGSDGFSVGSWLGAAGNGTIRDLKVAALGADGWPDIIVGMDNEIDVFSARAAGMWVYTSVASVVGAPTLLAHDLDVDGLIDVIFADDLGLHWLDAGDRWVAYTLSDAAAITPMVADFDHDGDPDLAGLEAGGVWWQDNASVHRSSVFSGPVVLDTTAAWPEHLQAADLDRDGDQDVVVAYRQGAEVAWLENKQGAWAHHTMGTPNGPFELAVGDVNGDGTPDVVAGTTAGAILFRNMVSGWPNARIGNTTGVTGIGLADLNHDGQLDVGMSYYTSSSYLAVSINDGQSLPGWTDELVANVNGAWPVALADVDNDGDTDLVSGATVGAVEIYTNEGALPWQQALQQSTGGSVQWLDIADHGHDGDLDLLVSNGGGQAVRWLDSEAGAWTLVDIAYVDGQGVRAADLDRDGDLDVVVALGTGLAVYEAQAGAYQAQTLQSGTQSVLGVAVADIDGDGDLDLITTGAATDPYTYDVTAFVQTSAHARMEVVAVAPLLTAGSAQALVRLDLTHLGRAGDESITLDALSLAFTNAAGTLTYDDLHRTLVGLTLWRDDGDGLFSAASDSLLSEEGFIPFVGPALWTLAVPRALNVGVGASWFLVATMSDEADKLGVAELELVITPAESVASQRGSIPLQVVGAPATVSLAVDVLPDADGDGYRTPLDCDDNDALIHPGAVERCNGLDDDCVNGLTPVEQDLDGDGYMACKNFVASGSPKEGGDDCNDAYAAASPANTTELCDGLDNDCDGVLPDEEQDFDNDGFVACSAVDLPLTKQPGDCGPTDPNTYPGAPELCDDLDNNCDADPMDGFETWDTDSDGLRNCDDCAPGDPSLNANTVWYYDGDADGYGSSSDTQVQCEAPDLFAWVREGGDCDDGDNAIHPGAEEYCGDGVDSDCDGEGRGTFDDIDGVGVDMAYPDQDGDGYGASSEGVPICGEQPGWVANPDDCDDSRADVRPGATDPCGDGVDQDCDGADNCGDEQIVDVDVVYPGFACASGGGTTGLWWPLLMLLLWRRRGASTCP